MKKINSLILILSLGLASSVSAQKKTIDQRVDSVMKLMTLKEKVGQLNQYSGREVTGPSSDRKNLLQHSESPAIWNNYLECNRC